MLVMNNTFNSAYMEYEDKENIFYPRNEGVSTVLDLADSSDTKKSTLNECQKKALKTMLHEKNVFLTGAAGTGKSYLLNEFINIIGRNNCVILGTTGISAIKMGGSTIHRFFDIPCGVLNRSIQIYEDKDASIGVFMRNANALGFVKALIIDEISMCRCDVFNYIASIVNYVRKNLNPDLKLILCGDFYQLPPVVGNREKAVFSKLYSNNTEGWAFKSEKWKNLGIKNIYLTEVIRQKDRDFVRALTSIRNGDTTGISYINSFRPKGAYKNQIILCGKNETAEDINAKFLSAIPGEEFSYNVSIEGDVKKSELTCPEHLTLKVGARVLFIANDPSKNYFNGDTGTIQAINQGNIFVINDRSGKTVIVNSYTWDVYDYKQADNEKKLKQILVGRFNQIPLRLGWAITVHKSQGQTYDNVWIEHSDFWSFGQLYVALSRCTSLEKTYMPYDISYRSFKSSYDVQLFYEEYEFF